MSSNYNILTGHSRENQQDKLVYIEDLAMEVEILMSREF